MSKIYLDLLDKKRRKIFVALSAFKKRGYLAGGTALALQLNHRDSEDFDVFINKAVDNKLLLKIKSVFGKVNFYINTTDQVSFTTTDGVNITFLWYYYQPLLPLIKTSGLSLVSVFDIAADKARTVGRRAIWRDYVDLFVILKNRVLALKRIIALARKKFAGEFVEAQFLEQLAFFGDLKESPIDFIGQQYFSLEIKFFLEKQVSSYIKETLIK